MFGNGVTHTILSSGVSQFFSLAVFHQAIQVRNGIESGYYSESQPGNFIPTFTASQSGNVSAKGNIYCESILTGPNIYTKNEVHSQISNSFKSGVLRLYDDDATERGIILHPTAVHFAVNGFLPNNRRSNHNDDGPNIRRRY